MLPCAPSSQVMTLCSVALSPCVSVCSRKQDSSKAGSGFMIIPFSSFLKMCLHYLSLLRFDGDGSSYDVHHGVSDDCQHWAQRLETTGLGLRVVLCVCLYFYPIYLFNNSQYTKKNQCCMLACSISSYLQ